MTNFHNVYTFLAFIFGKPIVTAQSKTTSNNKTT